MALPGTVLKMRDLLLRAGVVDDYQMRSALARLEQWGGRLPRVLADLGMVDEEQVAQAIAGALRLPLQAMGTLTRDPDAMGRLDAGFCEEHAVFPVSLHARTHTLVLAMADPTALDVVDLAAARAGARVQTVVASESAILAAVERLYRGRAVPLTTQPNLARRAVTATLEGPDEGSPELATAVGAPAAGTLLDELMRGPSPAAELDPGQVKLLEELQRRQGMTTTILRALEELLADKGLSKR
jgi:hypothetical protein